jgi:uncharacterized membrane protein YgdD (TMEM256/DUF423 family)
VNPKLWLVLAALLGAADVALGSFHAHGLEQWLQKQTTDAGEVAKRMENCATGLKYQMYHALALCAVGLLAFRQNSAALTAAGVCFFLGVLLFSGMLYGIVFTGVKILGAIVPIGGVLMIVGWLALAWAAVGMQAPPK